MDNSKDSLTHGGSSVTTGLEDKNVINTSENSSNDTEFISQKAGKSGRKSNRKRNILIFFILFITVAYFAAGIAAKRCISQKIRNIAASYHCSVSWSSLKFSLITKSLTINNINIIRNDFRFSSSELLIPVLFKFPFKTDNLSLHLKSADLVVNPSLQKDMYSLFDKSGLSKLYGDVTAGFQVNDGNMAVHFNAEIDGAGILDMDMLIGGIVEKDVFEAFKGLKYKRVLNFNMVFIDKGLVKSVINRFGIFNGEDYYVSRQRVLDGINRRINSVKSNVDERAILSQVYRFMNNPGKISVRLISSTDAVLMDLLPGDTYGWRGLTVWLSGLRCVFTSS